MICMEIENCERDTQIRIDASGTPLEQLEELSKGCAAHIKTLGEISDCHPYLLNEILHSQITKYLHK